MIAIPHLSIRCPRCGDKTSMPPVSDPIQVVRNYQTEDGFVGPLVAVLHTCTNTDCAGATIGYYLGGDRQAWRFRYHRPRYDTLVIPEAVPKRPRTILQDANDACDFPVACTGAAVRAVAAMMAEMKYKKGGVLPRIEKAVADGVLPKVVGDWAKEVRNIGVTAYTDDDSGPLPTKDDAQESLLFANTLAQYLFILPSRIPTLRKPGKKKPSRKTPDARKTPYIM